MPFCTSCGRENPDGARFCAACGTQLEAVAAAPAREVRKTVTILFSDLTGSTGLGERLDPESLRRVMSRYFEEMRGVLERHGGTVEKFIGDAIVAVFGVPVLHEDDGLRAVRAAAEMRTRLAALNEEFERERGVRIAVRTGLNTGEVVVGNPNAGQGIVLGDAVNVAARLEQSAQPDEILLGEATYQLVKDAVVADEVDPLSLKGKGEPVPARRLLEVDPVAAGHTRGLDSPMVGRTHERKLLHEAYARAVRERSCNLFTVLGAAGVGKSRLVLEFIATVEGEARVLQGRCLPYGEGITFWPLVEALKEAAGIDGETGTDARARIAALLEGDENADEIAGLVAQLLGFAEVTAGADETFWAVRKVFEALARERSLVVVFDDIHWAEATLLDLIEHVADWARDEPILLVCMARPELLDTRPTWGGGKLNAASVLLEPLNEAECDLLLANLLGEAQAALDVRAKVIEAAEGNPLFVEEMIAMLIDEGVITRRDGGWAATGDLSQVAVPPTIHALLAARLDRLSDDERSLLERASVEGRSFHRGALHVLLGDGAGTTFLTQLQSLVRKELIRPDRATFAGEDAFKFRHVLIRDAAYRGMSKDARAELHERFADWLDSKAAGRETEFEEILAYHLEQAVRYRADLGPPDDRSRALGLQASGHFAAAGRRAALRSDVPAAANLLGRAAALAPELPGRLNLLLELAQALRATGELARAEAVLSDALREATAAGDRRGEAHALIDGMLLKSLVDTEFRTTELLEAAESSMQVLEEVGDELGLAKAWRGIAEVHLTSCHWQATVEALEHALDHARRAGDDREAGTALLLLANALYWGPTPADEGRRRCDEILAETRGHRTAEANVVCFAAGFEAMQGNGEEATRLIRDGRALFEEVGHTYGLINHTLLSGSVALLAGDAAAAERDLRWSVELLEGMGETGVLPSLAALLAEALYVQGRLEEAHRFTELSEDTAHSDDVAAQIAWRTVRAKALAREGQTGQAESLLRQALELVEETDVLNMQADVELAFADVLGVADRPEEAVRHARAAAVLYERKGNVVAAARVRDGVGVSYS